MVHVTINITRRSNQKKKTRKQSIESSAVCSQSAIHSLSWVVRENFLRAHLYFSTCPITYFSRTSSHSVCG